MNYVNEKEYDFYMWSKNYEMDFFFPKKIIVQINLRSLLLCLVYLNVKNWLERMWIWIFSLIYWEEYLDVWSLTFFFLYFLSSIFGQMTNFSFFQKNIVFFKDPWMNLPRFCKNCFVIFSTVVKQSCCQ